MDVLKKNKYVILLLITILFVSLSFSIIINIPLREGATCLPDCDKVSMNETTGTIPDCKEDNEEFLNQKDAKTIVNHCITPFIKNINSLMETKYSYKRIYKTLYKKKTRQKPQKELNAYFKDKTSVTIQDIMDKLCENIDKITQNSALKKKNISQIINDLRRYKGDREIPSSDIKQRYQQFISCVEKYMISVTARCKDYYSDNNFNNLINEAKGKPLCYSLSSSFHKLRTYIIDGVNNKLDVSNDPGDDDEIE
jgi:hypothetical protein